MVTHNPGVWFDETLTSLAEQDYRNLAILVIDAGSEVDLTDRIVSLAPDAYVRRLRSNPGFSTAANLALEMVEGATFYLFCHDDVALEPGAVKQLVEEAYRSNAGLLGPKLVRWDSPDRLQAAGLQSDKFGHPVSIAEPDELDQEQHDAVRDVFFVPSAALLIRSDLFRALGGFDEGIPLHGEDTDLCWRAHLAGARVLVMPARVRHVEALGERRDDDSRRLQMRHRLRMVLSNYGLFYLAAVLPQQMFLSLAEFVGAVFTGRFRHAADVAGAYLWNLRNLPGIIAKRRRVRRVRQITDLELRRLQVRGSARAMAYLRARLAGGRPADLGRTGRQFVTAMRAGLTQGSAVVVAVVALVLFFGARHLFSQTMPTIGEFTAAPDSALGPAREWWSGWRSTGLGSAGSVPFLLALQGGLGALLVGGQTLARQVLIIGLLPLGYVGAWRLGRLGRSGRSQVAALVAYAANPVAYSALASGSWRGLAAYAAAPWVLRKLVVASHDEPFEPATEDGSTTPMSPRRRLVRQVAGLGVVTALASAIYPWAPGLVALAVVGVVIGSALVGRWRGVGRLALVGVAGAAVGVALHAPWWWSALGSGDPDVTPAGRAGGGAYSLADALHFGVGPFAGSRLSWGLLIAPLLSLAIGRGWRLVWAGRAWAIAGVCWALVAASRYDLFSLRLPPAEVLLAPAAAALALACGLGVAAFERDLPGYRFGWRQLASLAAVGALSLASLSLVSRSFDGRWDVPARGWDRALRFQTDELADIGRFRVLWLGDDAVLPAAGWPLPDEVGAGSYTTTVGVPESRNLFAGPEHDTRLLADSLAAASRGDTTRLGRLLAPASVRYIVVVDKLAPDPDPGIESPADPRFVELLSGQLDLEEVDVNGAIRVFRNASWMPYVAAIPAAIDGPGLAPAGFDPATATQALMADGPRHAEGTVESRTVLHVAESRSPNWQLSVDGAEAAAIDTGWANQFRVVGKGAAELSYRPSGSRQLVNAAQLAAWLALLVVAMQQPSGRRARALRRKALVEGNEPVVVTRNLVVEPGATEGAVLGAAAAAAAPAVVALTPADPAADPAEAAEPQVESSTEGQLSRLLIDDDREPLVDIDEVLAPEPEFELPDFDGPIVDEPDIESYADLASLDVELATPPPIEPVISDLGTNGSTHRSPDAAGAIDEDLEDGWTTIDLDVTVEDPNEAGR